MKNGKPATGWLQDDKKWYWLDNSGRMFASGWKQIGGMEIGPNGARKHDGKA